MLVEGQCLVLLDGLDEVGDHEKRQRVAAWVDDQVGRYPRALFVLTARPMGYQTAPLVRAHVLEVLPFMLEQTQRFVHNWYLANEIMRAGGHVDTGVRQKAEMQAGDLLRRLQANPALHQLTKNPLLLTMLTTVHSQRNALPGGRVELYGEIADVLLGHWQRAKGLGQALSVGQLRAALEPLAMQMMRERVRELRSAEVLAALQGPLAEIGVRGADVITFLPTIQAASGLFLELRPDSWGFAHLSFQEYMAACFLRRRGMGFDWSYVVQDSWWHETLRLYAAQGDATALLQACLKKDTVEAMVLASECLEEAERLDPAVRVEAEERLVQALDSPDSRLRRLAAEVKLIRRLQSLAASEDELAFDPEYITCAEYGLFVTEQGPEGWSSWPDSWAGAHVPAGKAQTPVVGVRFKDAQAFATWLTKRRDGSRQQGMSTQETYRLPTPPETEAYRGSAISDVLAWCSNGELKGRIGSELEATLLALSRLPLPASNNRVRDLDTDPNLERIRTLSNLPLPPTITLPGSVDDSFLRALPMSRSFGLKRTHELAIAFAIDKAHDLIFASELVYQLARDFEFSHGLRTRANSLQRAVLKRDFAEVRSLVRMEELAGGQHIAGIDTLILDVIDIAESLEAIPATSCRYVIHLTEHLWHGLGENDERSVSAKARLLLHVHWAYVIKLARIEGKLPVWEGIRLVRERKVEDGAEGSPSRQRARRIAVQR